MQAPPRSLATTCGISVDFFSSGYLDGSVLQVRFSSPMYSDWDTHCCVGFPIRTSRDHCSFASFSALFAGLHVLLRLSSPRHPPDALIHLTLSFEEPSDFVTNGVDNHRYLDSLLWQSLLLVVYCSCLLSLKNNSIQSSPKFTFDLFYTFSGCSKHCCISIPNQINHCLCLLISAFQFVKDRCVTVKTALQIKVSWTFYNNSL